VHFGDPETTSLKGNFHEAYLFQFLAKEGAKKAEIRDFGHFKAIGAIYLAF
jgi:hypothetical protein